MKNKEFVPSREMSFQTVMADRQRLLDYCATLKKSPMILNLSQVDQCDSAGLAFLIEARRLAQERQLICHIEGMTRAVHALAEFCGVDSILSAYDK